MATIVTLIIAYSCHQKRLLTLVIVEVEGSDDGTTDPNTVCKECASFDLTIEGVSDGFFIALGNLRPDTEPAYFESCEDLESASDVAIACKKYVVKYFDCLSESKSISESDDGIKKPGSESDDSNSSTITVTGTAMTLTAMAVTLA